MIRRLLVVFSVAFLLLGATIALADNISVNFNVAPTLTAATLTMGDDDPPNSDTQPITFGGSIHADLNVSYDGGGNATVNSIEFTPVQHTSPWQPTYQVNYPGGLSASDVNFQVDNENIEDNWGYPVGIGVLADLTDLSMNLNSNAVASTVTGGQFSVTGKKMDIPGGLAYSNLMTGDVVTDLEDNFYPQPAQGGPSIDLGDAYDGGGARHLTLTDAEALSTITMTKVGGGYVLQLDLLGSYSGGVDPGMTLSGAAALIGTASIGDVNPTPEPGTLVMVLGLVASLAVYGWKRRGSR
jgi:hypothetical protein